jgi:hypothetical protein
MKNMNEKLLDAFIRKGVDAYPLRFWKPAAEYQDGMLLINLKRGETLQ